MIRKYAKWPCVVLYLPFILLLMPFIGLGIGIIFINAMISGIVQRARWLRDLRRKAQAKPVAKMHGIANSGTLIVDRPGLNFKATRCWWTSEKVSDLSPVPIPVDEERIELCKQENKTTAHAFDVWCWQRYISPESGTAVLVMPPHHGEALAARIREHRPDLECIMSWSAIPAMQSRARPATSETDERETPENPLK
jgi:hypothetical protein